MGPNMTGQHARYLANPRQCIDCGAKPSAGRPRCARCHQRLIEDRNEGKAM